MIISDSIFQKVIKGNLKKSKSKRTINIQFTEDQIKEIEAKSLKEEIPRNQYISIALDHYWHCKNVKKQ